MEVERACQCQDKLKNEHNCKVFRHEELEEKLKDELCKVRQAQQAEECFEVEDTEEEIEDEFNLDLLERLCDNT